MSRIYQSVPNWLRCSASMEDEYLVFTYFVPNNSIGFTNSVIASVTRKESVDDRWNMFPVLLNEFRLKLNRSDNLFALQRRTQTHKIGWRRLLSLTWRWQPASAIAHRCFSIDIFAIPVLVGSVARGNGCLWVGAVCPSGGRFFGGSVSTPGLHIVKWQEFVVCLSLVSTVSVGVGDFFEGRRWGRRRVTTNIQSHCLSSRTHGVERRGPKMCLRGSGDPRTTLMLLLGYQR
jgi:hypothetical protein